MDEITFELVFELCFFRPCIPAPIPNWDVSIRRRRSEQA